MTGYACFKCARPSPTRLCPEHGGTDKRPTFSARGYGTEFRKNRNTLLIANPNCSVNGCDEPAVAAHHNPPRRTLIALNVENPDGIEWLIPLCVSHHNSESARGR